MGRTGCVTCKGKWRSEPSREARRPLTQSARAITCDRLRPNCTHCSRFNLKCQWYGPTLSWPRSDDRRRSIVSDSFSPGSSLHTTGPISDTRFLHTSNWDIEFYRSMTSSVPIRALSLLDEPMFWNPSTLDTVDQDLLGYCMFCKPA